MTTVYYFKLMNGDDLLASVLEENEKNVIVNYPLCIENMPHEEDNMMSLVFVPWVPSVKLLKNSFSIARSNIVAQSLSPEEFLTSYHQVIANIDNPRPYDETEEQEDDEDYEMTGSDNKVYH